MLGTAQIQELFGLDASGLWTEAELAIHFDTSTTEVHDVLHRIDCYSRLANIGRYQDN